MQRAFLQRKDTAQRGTQLFGPFLIQGWQWRQAVPSRKGTNLTTTGGFNQSHLQDPLVCFFAAKLLVTGESYFQTESTDNQMYHGPMVSLSELPNMLLELDVKGIFIKLLLLH